MLIAVSTISANTFSAGAQRRKKASQQTLTTEMSESQLEAGVIDSVYGSLVG